MKRARSGATVRGVMLLSGRTTSTGGGAGATTTPPSPPTSGRRRITLGVILLVVLMLCVPSPKHFRSSSYSSSPSASHAQSASEEYAQEIYRRLGKGAQAMGYTAGGSAGRRSGGEVGGGHGRPGRYVRPVVLLIGDSLVQRSFEPGGWGSRFAHEYARSADVVLRGYSGYNTRWVKDLMRRQPTLFPPAQHVALVVILLVREKAQPVSFPPNFVFVLSPRARVRALSSFFPTAPSPRTHQNAP